MQTDDMSPEELRDIRAQLKLTQEKMAYDLGVTVRGLRQFERGERTITGPVRNLARLLLAING